MFQLIEEKYCYNVSEEDSRKKFEFSLEKLLVNTLKSNQDLIVLCIGSEYIVGDCLGPLVGYKLSSKYPKLAVYGDFNHTVHSANLFETIQYIREKYKNPFIIVIDSALCSDSTQIGNVKLWGGGLVPGNAFEKELPCVGHISIIGMTNSRLTFARFMQTTRMGLVMQLADFIETGLSNTLKKINLIN